MQTARANNDDVYVVTVTHISDYESGTFGMYQSNLGGPYNMVDGGCFAYDNCNMQLHIFIDATKENIVTIENCKKEDIELHIVNTMVKIANENE